MRREQKRNKLSKDWSWLSKQWITDGHNTTTEGMLIFLATRAQQTFTGLFLLQTASTHTYTYTCMYVCMYKHTHTHHTSKSLWTLQFRSNNADLSMPADCPGVATPVHMVPIRWHLQHMTQTDGRMCHCKRLHFQIRGVGRSADSFTHCGPCHADRKWHSNLFIIQMPRGGKTKCRI